MSELYIGLMSGTSLDAVDAVAVSIDSNNITLISSHQEIIPHQLRQHILGICTGQATNLHDIGVIDHKLGLLYAATVTALLKKASLESKQIRAIGNHGQTVFHHPAGQSRFTIQLGDANLIAARTGIDTVADFRRMDMAVGGQGAPLAPAFHQFVFSKQDVTTVILNIGGIANLTLLPKTGPVIGFDTGPGNVLMDSWCEKHTGNQYDKDAHMAKQGQVNTGLLNELMSDPFLAKIPPKSTGREYFNLNWLESQLSKHHIPLDVQRTLCEFTALSISQHLQTLSDQPEIELLVCGGGANNPLLMNLIRQYLPTWRVLRTADRGVPGDDMEAMAFAWLAHRRIHNQPSNLPSVTGASREVSLGVLYQAPAACNNGSLD